MPAPGTQGIRRIVLRPGLLTVKARGASWPCDLGAATQRAPVSVVLRIAGTRYCAAFGPATRNTSGRFAAGPSAAPAACPETDATAAFLNILHGIFCPAPTASCRLAERIDLLFQWVAAAGCPDVVTLTEVNDPSVPLIDAHLANGPLVRYTSTTVTEAKRLKEELQRIRRQGYSIDNQEFMSGVVCIAVALRTPGSALTVSPRLAERLAWQGRNLAAERITACLNGLGLVISKRLVAMMEGEIGPRPICLQAPMLVGVEQAVEVETRRPLVPGLQYRLGIIKAYSPDVLGQLAVGACQVLRGGAKPAVRRIDLLDEPDKFGIPFVIYGLGVHAQSYARRWQLLDRYRFWVDGTIQLQSRQRAHGFVTVLFADLPEKLLVGRQDANFRNVRLQAHQESRGADDIVEKKAHRRQAR